jgi:hypothetical protein
MLGMEIITLAHITELKSKKAGFSYPVYLLSP